VRSAHQVDVDAALPRAWAALLDVGRWGGGVERASVDGAYRARVSIDGEQYAGTVRLVDADDDEHVATFHVIGHGHGGRDAAATVAVRASARGDASLMAVEAEARPDPADPGGARAALAALLDDLAAALAREPAEPVATSDAPAPAPTALGGAALQPVLERAALIAAGIAVGVALHRVVRRRGGGGRSASVRGLAG
jgi:carbon monoxide dehydrogenase subunit G